MSDYANTKDALVYSQIKNNLVINKTDDVYPKYKSIAGDDNPDNIDKRFTELLNSTTIKRACCMNKLGNTKGSGVFVRIFEETGQMKDKEVYVDATICENISEDGSTVTYKPGNNQCNNFMRVYCDNMKKIFKDKVAAQNGLYSNLDFANDKPECACYGDVPHDAY